MRIQSGYSQNTGRIQSGYREDTVRILSGYREDKVRIQGTEGVFITKTCHMQILIHKMALCFAYVGVKCKLSFQMEEGVFTTRSEHGTAWRLLP